MRADVPQLPQYVFMEWYLDKHRGNFTLNRYLTYDRTREQLS